MSYITVAAAIFARSSATKEATKPIMLIAPARATAVASRAHPRRCRAHGERASISTATRMNDAATGETSLSNVFVAKCELSPTLIAAISIPLLIAWIHTVVDTFMRPDIGAVAKFRWVLLVLFIPLVGILVWFIARPARA